MPPGCSDPQEGAGLGAMLGFLQPQQWHRGDFAPHPIARAVSPSPGPQCGLCPPGGGFPPGIRSGLCGCGCGRSARRDCTGVGSACGDVVGTRWGRPPGSQQCSVWGSGHRSPIAVPGGGYPYVEMPINPLPASHNPTQMSPVGPGAGGDTVTPRPLAGATHRTTRGTRGRAARPSSPTSRCCVWPWARPRWCCCCSSCSLSSLPRSSTCSRRRTANCAKPSEWGDPGGDGVLSSCPPARWQLGTWGSSGFILPALWMGTAGGLGAAADIRHCGHRCIPWGRSGRSGVTPCNRCLISSQSRARRKRSHGSLTSS